MHGKNLRNAASLGLLALVFVLPLRAQQDAQQSGSSDAVAEAARKAKEEKKDSAKPKRVYTDDDIAASKGNVSVVGTAPAQADSASTTSTSVADSKGTMTPEQMWRKRFAEQRAKLSQAEKELDILQREENKAGLQYYSDPTKAMKEQLTRDEINQKAAKVQAKKKQIEDLKQQLEDMQDELRKAGGDPGWGR